MEKYCKDKLKSISGQASYQAVVEYLESCEDGEEYLVKYRRVFEGDEYVLVTDDERISPMLKRYEDYLKHVLQTEMTVEAAKNYIVDCFSEFFPTVQTFDDFRVAFTSFFTDFGYFAQFGVTHPFPTLYLWKTQNKSELDIELPETTIKLNVYEMDDIVTNCWQSYLTFGKSGTGGWVTDKVDGVYYFKEKYDTDSEDFKVSLLKHEGQHYHDLGQEPDMSSVDLEYRAKLVELVYLQEQDTFNSFIDQMSDEPKFPHGYANKRIVSELSQKIFGEELVTSKERWSIVYEKVSEQASRLLKADTLSRSCQ